MGYDCSPVGFCKNPADVPNKTIWSVMQRHEFTDILAARLVLLRHPRLNEMHISP